MLASFLSDLGRPEYMHTLLNPLPVYGLGMAVLGLILALAFRNRGGQTLALTLILISCATIWPVIHYGHKAYDDVLTLADDDGRAWLKEHDHRADQLEYFFYATAALAAIALGAQQKWPPAAMPLTLATLLLALCSLGAGASIAYAGGKIRHREFRTVPPPATSAEE